MRWATACYLPLAERKVTNRREEVMIPEEEVTTCRLRTPFLTKKEIPTQWKLHRDVF